MYRLMIVDDEPLILGSFDSLMPWEDYGIERILKATSGLQALEILRNEPVDILITDIKMPGMDGLTLISRVRAMNLPVSIVVLSGYDDFMLAKRALAWGIENYLLKPVEEKELGGTLLGIVDKLEKKRAQDIRIREGTNLLRENIILRLVTGSIGDAEVIDRIGFLGMNLHGEYVMAASLQLREGGMDYPEMSRLAMDVSDEKNIWCAPDPDGGIAILFCWSGDEANESLCRQRLTERIRLPESAYAVRFGSVRLGWSMAHASWMDAHEPAGSGENYPVVDLVREYVARNLSEEVSLKTLAQRFHVNAAYLGQIFKKATGEIFSTYLTRTRIDQAKELLWQSDDKVCEIARKVGYGNNSYFSNQFKSLTGLYPIQYRRKRDERT